MAIAKTAARGLHLRQPMRYRAAKSNNMAEMFTRYAACQRRPKTKYKGAGNAAMRGALNPNAEFKLQKYPDKPCCVRESYTVSDLARYHASSQLGGTWSREIQMNVMVAKSAK